MFHIDNITRSFTPSFGQVVPIKTPLVVLGGVSGVGKTSVSWNLLQRQPNIRLLKTTTTRPPRNLEKEDLHYQFVTQEQFAKQQLADGFLVCTVWSGNGQAYGLAKSEFAAAQDHDFRLCASTYYGTLLKAQAPHNVLHIWLLCSDLTELKNRLKNRQPSNEDQVARRWETAVSEQAYVLQQQHQLLVQNQIDVLVDTADRSIEEVAKGIDECIGYFLQGKSFSISGVVTG